MRSNQQNLILLMKKQVNKLSLNKVTVNQLEADQGAVKGGFTPIITVTIVLTLLVCSPVPAGSSSKDAMSKSC